MRFAGSEPITDYLKNSINHGAIAQAGAMTRSAVDQAGTQLEGDVGATGLTSASEVEAAGILGAAQSALAGAQGQASIMSTIGGIAGDAIGQFGGGGGGTDLSNISLGSSPNIPSTKSWGEITPNYDFFKI